MTRAYFDFDGTLSTLDTFIPFLIHALGYPRLLVNLPKLLWISLLYGTKKIDNEVAKERVVTLLLTGRSLEGLESKAQSFAEHHLKKYIKPSVFSRLQHHKELGHSIILVSANLGIYLRHFAKLHGIDDVIATEIEFVDGKATGKLATRNCYGAEKVTRIKQYLVDHHETDDYSYAYGNSKGDYEMLDYVNEAYWVAKHKVSPWGFRSATPKRAMLPQEPGFRKNGF